MTSQWWDWIGEMRSENRFRECWKLRPLVVSDPLPAHNKSGELILRKFLAILGALCERVRLVSGNLGPLAENRPAWLEFEDNTYSTAGCGFFEKGLRYARLQTQTAAQLDARCRNGIDTVFFFNAAALLLPLLAATASGLETTMFHLGDICAGVRKKYTGMGKRAAEGLVGGLQGLGLRLAGRIAVDSPHAAATPLLGKHRPRIGYISTFADPDLFRQTICIGDRPVQVGYIGRLAVEKGIFQLLDAIPAVLGEYPGVRFHIIGSGPLEAAVRNRISEDKTLRGGVIFAPWINYDEVPEVLNTFRLLVLPSDTEGLPNVVLESMACGTPVLATPVGGVPDVVVPGKTGWLLPDNRPETIAACTADALKSSDLAGISKNAAELVLKDYGPKAAVERLRLFLDPT